MQLYLAGKKYNIDLKGGASDIYDILTQEEIEKEIFSYLSKDKDNDLTAILKAFISLCVENRALKNEISKILQKIEQ